MSLQAQTVIKSISVLFLVLSSLSLALAQQPSSSSTRPSFDMEMEPPVMLRTPARILAAFVKSETRVREALNQHTFKRDVVLQTIGPEGQITGEYIRNSQFIFDDTGNRIERVTYHPPSTIREMRITREDIQDLAGAQLLGIDIVESTKYLLSYNGQEMLEGRRSYALLEGTVFSRPRLDRCRNVSDCKSQRCS